MSHFDGLRVFNFNHCSDSPQHVDALLITYAVSFVESGQIYWAPGSEERRILEGPVAFWTWPGERWSYGPVDQTWDNRFCSWKGERAEQLARRGLFPRCALDQAFCQISDPLRFKTEFEHLHQLLAEQAPDSPRVVHTLEGLLLLLQEQREKPVLNYGPAMRVKEAIESVRAHPEHAWDFAREAKHASCTPAHFRKLWKQQTGCSPIQFLQKSRINLAAALLRQGNLSVEQVSITCGFENLSYFYRLFLYHHEVAPGQYRRTYQTIC